jgi:hypothetical protein
LKARRDSEHKKNIRLNLACCDILGVGESLKTKMRSHEIESAVDDSVATVGRRVIRPIREGSCCEWGVLSVTEASLGAVYFKVCPRFPLTQLLCDDHWPFLLPT